MGDRGNDGSGDANGGDVPMYSRKIIQSLKEIVNCSDFEIYTMLVECDMDPNETVNRLISQGTFQEVKSKRNKRKETKNLDDFWSKPFLGGVNKSNSNEMGSAQVVVANRRRNGPRYHSPGSLKSGVLRCQTQPNSVEIKKAPTVSSDAITSSSVPSLTHESAWASANLGERAMVDIVKMGRPSLQEKNVASPHSPETQESGSKVHVHDGWPLVEKKDVLDDEEEHDSLPKDNEPGVIIPSHLQVDTSEYSHILFGSFSSGIRDDQGIGLKISLEETPKVEDDPSYIHPTTEEEEKLTNVGNDEKTSYQIDSTPQASSDANAEEVQHEPPQKEHQYMHWYTEDYGLENNQRFNPPSETNHRMQMLDMFPDTTQQGYTSSLSNILVPSGIRDARDSNLYYSPFPIIYNTSIASSSLSDPTISMAEALRVASISPPNSEQQQGVPYVQHHTYIPYTHQLGLPLESYCSLMSYPYMQRSFNPCNPLYPNTATNSYEDVLSSHFQERIHLASPHYQNENSVVWLQGQHPNSLVVPGSVYYNFVGHQNQQPPDFCHVQQLQQQHLPSQQQHFGGYGYANLYYSQVAMSLDHLYHQDENARDASEQPQE